MAQPASDQAPDSHGALSLGARAEIYPNRPLPDFDSPGGQAYAARLRGDTRGDLMAIVCASGIPARQESINAMRLVDNPCILRLRESGVVDWLPQSARRFALAYDRPLAPRYWSHLNEVHTPLSEDGLNHYFVRPMVSALVEFLRTGLVHGSIRPTNIYWNNGGVMAPQLGECLSMPSGITQPVLFETIERGMCPPSGRGPGQHTDDCYAFGVTLALMILGRNPLQAMDDTAVLRAKIDKGTFNALIGQRRIAASHTELLRGLLADDARQRWTAAELDQWISGRRLTPKSTDAGRRASRCFTLAGGEYWTLRPLAMALAQHSVEAVRLIENDSLTKWLKRSFGDEDKAQDVEDTVADLKETGQTAQYEHNLVARVCCVLDPAAPIRYRDTVVMPDGIATMLVETMRTGASPQTLAEIIGHQLVTFWVNQQKEAKPDLIPLAKQMERLRGAVEQPRFGGGLERAVYELNPHLPCLSPILQNDYVATTRQMMPALEAVAARADRPTEPMDRHIAAFLVVRDKRSERLFETISTSGPSQRGIALLTLYSELQYRYGPDRLPNMAAWLHPMLDSATRRYLSKPYQDKIKKQLQEAVTAGVLSVLLDLVDDPRRVEHDQNDFLMARRMYADIQAEMADIETRLSSRETMEATYGRPVATALAAALALILISVTLLRAVLQGLF